MAYHMICFLLLVIMGLFPQPLQTKASADGTEGQVIPSGRNLRNTVGNKVGLWVENNGQIEVYYKDGLRDGVFRLYEGNTWRLTLFGEFRNGRRVGIWYFFDREGYLYWVEKDIGENLGLSVKRDDGKSIVPKFRSYITEYYPNGVVKAEGIALYNEDPVIDYFKKGIWKYYDASGRPIRTEDHGQE